MKKIKVLPPQEMTEVRDVTPLSTRPLCWESFFRCQHSPMIRSQLLVSLMAGVKLQAARLPSTALLDAVLIATAARNHCDAEVVDDYQVLVDRIAEAWRAPDWTARVFDSIHAKAADDIVTRGATEFVCAEDQYIDGMVAWYLRQDPPHYFKRELETDKDLRAWRRAA